MMDRFTMYPVAFVTTVQPYLLAWVLAISFFVTMALVALMSKGKTWKQIAWMSVLSYGVVSIVTLLATTYFLDIQVIDLETFWVQPRGK